jgi:hypothetical protein
MARLFALFRQPLVHFLLIGAAIFGVFAALDDSSSAPSLQEIVVTTEKAEQLAAQFQSVWRRPPTGQELNSLVDDFIREEVLVREATALSLDLNDAVIRRRLRQKMEFLTDSAAGALKPSDEQLRAYFDANAERYSSDARIAFDQIFVGEAPSVEEIEQVRNVLTPEADHTLVGARTLLPPSLPMSLRSSVDGTFGRGFFDQLTEIEAGAWSNPVRSGYGIHIVRITERSDARILDFESVRDAVLRDWTKDKASEIAEAYYARMLERYSVSRPDISSIGVPQQ